MIIPLLSLILFAILFPGALRFLLLLMFIGAIMVSANAEPGQCFLKVDRKIYINKICNVEGENHGSWTLGAGQNHSEKYFVYLNRIDEGTMAGYWNGIEAESHAHDSLGILTKSGDCWANNRARVCSWRTTKTPPPRTQRQEFEYYTPGQMYSGPLGAHINPYAPHVMAPYPWQ